uniref:ZP domain-containing protein n=1 Tax=Myripristis murdjan TaxID=586833 RepID=A0A667Y8T8_9TELE
SGENDCSQWAACTNTWASYTCFCLDSFIDNNPARPGRACQGSITAAPVTTSTAPTTPYTSTITSIAPSTTTTTHQATPGAISVHCRATAITVTIARDFLVSKQISDSALHLGLEECGVNGGNTTHAQLTVGWHECDTMLLHNETFYTAQVTLFNTMDPQTLPNGTAEVPKIRLEVPIMCTYRKSMLISTGFGPMGYDMIKDAIMGSGSFHVTVQLMNGSMALPQNYSLSPAEDVVVQVSLNTSAEQIKVVINKCWATPSRNPTDSSSYTFLQNSCPLPNTYTTVLENGNTSTSRLSVRIFSFVNLDVIYLHCQVEICDHQCSYFPLRTALSEVGGFQTQLQHGVIIILQNYAIKMTAFCRGVCAFFCLKRKQVIVTRNMTNMTEA